MKKQTRKVLRVWWHGSHQVPIGIDRDGHWYGPTSLVEVLEEYVGPDSGSPDERIEAASKRFGGELVEESLSAKED
jgi:hypothetical protein